MKQVEELAIFDFILEYRPEYSNSINRLLRKPDFIAGIDKDTLLPILYNKLQNTEQRALQVVVIGYYTIPIIL